MLLQMTSKLLPEFYLVAPTTCLAGKWNIIKPVISNNTNEQCCF